MAHKPLPFSQLRACHWLAHTQATPTLQLRLHVIGGRGVDVGVGGACVRSQRERRGNTDGY